MKIRIKFAKYGAMKFIGHLDVMRFFQKAIRRADIDIRYSEGFSPHPIMSFAAPLGVGMESMGEYLDIEVRSMTSAEEMKNALNRAMTDGISVLSVKALPDTAQNAMASVAAARYQIAYRGEAVKNGQADTSLCRFPIDAMEEKLAVFYAKERIPVVKKTKKGERELDLRPGIFELKIEEAPHPFQKDGRRYQVISMLVDASSSGNIKPAMVFDAFCRDCNAALPPYSYQITRIDTLMNLAAEGEEPVFVPLGE
ncbi:MAG: TIGR03936 family radical SAM-associated protein [Blautia sp.]|nr:TIGR03936 family radical SAM-associated protein [Blautia sp.]MCM1200532.1 TIGR03936 family radical SAM-associated protein [Bacteroides fragilis]